MSAPISPSSSLDSEIQINVWQCAYYIAHRGRTPRGRSARSLEWLSKQVTAANEGLAESVAAAVSGAPPSPSSPGAEASDGEEPEILPVDDVQTDSSESGSGASASAHDVEEVEEDDESVGSEPSEYLDPSVVTWLTTLRTPDGGTMIHDAARRCDLELLFSAVAMGVPLEAVDSNGNRAIHVCCSSGPTHEFLTSMRNLGADLLSKNRAGRTPRGLLPDWTPMDVRFLLPPEKAERAGSSLVFLFLLVLMSSAVIRAVLIHPTTASIL